jgi:hypothetical protein
MDNMPKFNPTVTPALQVSPIVIDPPVVSVTSASAPAPQFVTGVPTVRAYSVSGRSPCRMKLIRVSLRLPYIYEMKAVTSVANLHVLCPQGEHCNIDSKLFVSLGVEVADG